jgi:hypothetical protein
MSALGLIAIQLFLQRLREESIQDEEQHILCEGISNGGGIGIRRNDDCDVFESVLLDGCAGTSKLLPISKSKVVYILYPMKDD